MKYGLFAALIISFTAGCSKSSDYTPPKEASGEDIFKASCVECHKEAAPKLFELAEDSATTDAIKKRIAEGNMMMPKFPNIQGESLDKLAEYVLTNSSTK